MNQYIFENVNEAYLALLSDVFANYDYKTAPRGFSTREKINCYITITSPQSYSIKTRDEERNKAMAEYLEREKKLYDIGTNKVEDFIGASKFWEKLANPDGTVNSAYGKLIWYDKMAGNEKFHNESKLTQWEWAKKSLLNDKYSRQSFILFLRPEHQWLGNRDIPCTTHGSFIIRNDILFFTVVMRSNDLVRGFPYDVPWFISLMDKMQDELKDEYPNLKKGSYTHIAHSLHIYERDEKVVLKMLGDGKLGSGV